MLYIIPPWLIYFIITSFYLLIHFTYFTQTLTALRSGNHLLDLFIYKSVFFILFCLLGLVFTFQIYMRPYGICLSLSKLFHLVWYPLDPSML